MNPKTLPLLLMATAMTVVLSACAGGGNGSDSQNPSSNPSPANAPPPSAPPSRTPKGYIVSTLAGMGDKGDADGPGLAAAFNVPSGIALGPDGSLYVAEGRIAHGGNNKIRRIAPDGAVSTYAGTGAEGLNDGACSSATFNNPTGIAVDKTGNVYVADSYNHAIRKITLMPACQVTTLAGSGTPGAADGKGTAVSFDYPTGLAVDAAGNVYVADTGNRKIRKITPAGIVATIAGNGALGTDDGAASGATFYQPTDMAVDAAGTLYVVDVTGIRRITSGNRRVSTLTDSGFKELTGDAEHVVTHVFSKPMTVAVDADGSLYVAANTDHRVFKVSPAGKVTPLAGSGEPGAADGPAGQATFGQPAGMAVDTHGVIYVIDSDYDQVRKITPVY